MEIWYKIVDTILPFEWTSYTFMKNALLGVILITPLFGLLGTMVVNNKMAFFADALGHSALTGIALGVILKIANPLWAMIIFAILLSIIIVKVKEANTASTDTIIGVFSSTAVALGIVILSYRGGFTKYNNYLIGDLLSITPSDLGMLVIVAIIVMVLWCLVFNRLLITGVNESLARSKGINAKLYMNIFTIIVAIVVTMSIQWVGVLIISSMLVLPAASARNISKNVRQYSIYSMLIALISGITGLIISYFLGSASGATMVLVSSCIFFITFIIKKLQS
ncbi:MAG: metal ABC transporter permease [Clostridiaceae bacterium]|nr:metal ABC transporter permease [Clostridiaceae bacterium]